MLAVVCGLPLAWRAAAATASARLVVTAIVVSGCRVSIAGLDFGAYDPDGANAEAPLDAAASLTLMCSYGSRPAIAIFGGQNARRVEGATRAMSDGADYLGYDIYSDPGRTRLWTDSGDGVVNLAPTSSGTQRVEVYGRIPPGQKLPPGPYEDMVRVRVDF